MQLSDFWILSLIRSDKLDNLSLNNTSLTKKKLMMNFLLHENLVEDVKPNEYSFIFNLLKRNVG